MLLLAAGSAWLRGGVLGQGTEDEAVEEVLTADDWGVALDTLAEAAEQAEQSAVVAPVAPPPPPPMGARERVKENRQLSGAAIMFLTKQHAMRRSWESQITRANKQAGLCPGLDVKYVEHVVKNCDALVVAPSVASGKVGTAPWSFAACFKKRAGGGTGVYVDVICAPPSRADVGGAAAYQLFNAIREDTLICGHPPHFMELSSVQKLQAVRAYYRYGFRFVHDCEQREHPRTTAFVEDLVDEANAQAAQGMASDMEVYREDPAKVWAHLTRNFMDSGLLVMRWCRGTGDGPFVSLMEEERGQASTPSNVPVVLLRPEEKRMWDAIENNDTAGLRRVLRTAKKDFNPNAVNEDGVTACYFAAEQENPELMKVLLEHPRMDPNQGKNGMTPLMYAATMADMAVAKVLLGDRRVDVNARDPNEFGSMGWTDTGRTALYATLQAAAENLEEQDGDMYTDFYNMMVFLIENKANINIATDQGDTPCAFAERVEGIDPFYYTLKKAGAKRCAGWLDE